jgi:hypothetical protein
MRLDVYFHNLPDVGVLSALETLIGKVNDMSAELDRLTAEVSETHSAVDSAVTLIAGLAQQIRDLSTDPAALNALADDLDAQQAAIAAAVAANTPTP